MFVTKLPPSWQCSLAKNMYICKKYNFFSIYNKTYFFLDRFMLYSVISIYMSLTNSVNTAKTSN